MRYASVCSGIEAPSVAWHPLGWSPVFFSEIDKFPRAVLAHHYPHVPNHGDMNGFKDWPDAAFDLLVGGTPCQSFSVAGLRKGLADPRGNLALTYLAIADRFKPAWVLWENVPGVLSSDGGRDFGAFLGGLGQLGYGWAYRVLDAQYVRVDGLGRAVPQRRRRVFVVGYLGDWRRAAAVLFERESLFWDSPPRREAGKGIAPTIAARTQGGGGLGTAFDCDGGLITEVANPLTARMVKGVNTTMDEGQTMVAHSLRADGFDASEDGTGRGTPLVAHPITAGMSASAARMPHEQGALLAFSCKDHGADAGEIAPTLRAMGHDGSHANAGGQVAIAIQERAVCENPDAGPDGAGVRDDGSAYTLEARTVPQAVAFQSKASPSNSMNPSTVAPSLDVGKSDGIAVACFKGGQGSKARDIGYSESLAPTLSAAESGTQLAPTLLQGWAVRRLTPLECERLQGFPDGYTAVPYRGKQAADGPRYKALGNSMACNVVRWLGTRIDMVEAALSEAARDA